MELIDAAAYRRTVELECGCRRTSCHRPSNIRLIGSCTTSTYHDNWSRHVGAVFECQHDCRIRTKVSRAAVHVDNAARVFWSDSRRECNVRSRGVAKATGTRYNEVASYERRTELAAITQDVSNSIQRQAIVG